MGINLFRPHEPLLVQNILFSGSLSSILLLFCLVALLTYCYNALLPPHRRWGLSGPLYKLPPGPKGRFIVGSLLEWLKARDNGNITPWVSRVRCIVNNRFCATH